MHILDIAVRRPTLDDVFLELTGHHAQAGQGADAEPGGGRPAAAPSTSRSDPQSDAPEGTQR